MSVPLDDLAAPDPAPTPASPWSLSPVRVARGAAVVLPLLAIGAWAAADWRAVHAGAARLASADPAWLPAAGGFTCLGWVAAACVRQGAVPDRLPPGLLLASQFAAGAADHVLPASVGAHAVTLRFLRRQGVPLHRATASLALYSLVKPLAKTPVLLAVLLVFPDVLRLGALLPDRGTLLLVGGCVVLCPAVAALAVALVRPLRGPVRSFLRTALTDVRRLHRCPARVLALWGGAALAPLLQAGVVASVGAALGLPLSWSQVTFAFLAAGTAVGAVPAPGGIGPVDGALLFGLVAYGAPTALATATVIGYRVLTVWVPLLPGALVLSVLVQRRAL
ncbi:flippase-like domain-containing protein [Streptomyces actuosus]|uniref:Flippase-like domain-containing protein n=1 Tax=Streptomyces actuosus TaxID=1885 RepID=A0ABS2VUR7_STRAS|nr:lysylphosphatidylglycerol synthase transmembrane domain-containing protein [Streptomyces actuosus]MBN0046873.1 flippase-like domain-containing protein [Streptomyces actuosus]